MRNRIDLAVILTATIIVRLSAFFLPMNRDSGTFAYGGWRILNGELPYIHFWDNKPPGVFYINALAIKLFGASPFGLVAFQMLTGIISAWLFYLVAAKFTGRRAALTASLLFAFYHGCYGLNEEGNFTESYLAAPVLLGVYLMLLWSEKGRQGWLVPAAAGACGAVAGLIKQPGASVIPALILFTFFSVKGRSRWLYAGNVLLGAAAVVLGAIVWMAQNGMLAGAYEANVTFNRLYAADAYTTNWSAAQWNLLRSLVLCSLPLAGALACVVCGRLANLPVRAGVWLIVPWFLLDLAGLAVGGRYYTHYFLAVLPSSLLLTAVFLDGLTSRKAVVVSAAVGLLFFAGPVWSIKGSLPERQAFPISSVLERQYHSVKWVLVRRLGQGIMLPAEEIALWLEEITTPSDTIYVWGYDPRIGFLAERAFPSKYIHLHPLGADGFGREARIAELADNIKIRRPKYIVDQSSLPQMRLTAPPLDINTPPPATSQKLFRLDGYEPVQEVVNRYYEPVDIVAGCLIYKLK